MADNRDDIRAAAERLRNLWNGGTLDSAYGVNLSLDGQRQYCSFDMELLARAIVFDPTPEMIEAAAKAMWEALPGNRPWEQSTHLDRAFLLAQAPAAIAAYRKSIGVA